MNLRSILPASALLWAGCNGTVVVVAPSASATYQNPIVTPVAADPTIVRADDGTFYLFATQDDWADGEGPHLLPIFRSDDLVTWTFVGDVFAEPPGWKADGFLWAPDVSRCGGGYCLYYAHSRWGDPNPCIGLATAERPGGPWTDLGRAVFCSADIGVENSIDPFVWAEDGLRTMVWGSFNGISSGSCCEGAESTYAVHVGRSDSLTGPYVDRKGHDLREGGGTLVLSQNPTWVGPGHVEVLTDAAGADWLVYHAILRADPRLSNGVNRRPALLDRIVWQDGWPVVNDGRGPSTTAQEAPALD